MILVKNSIKLPNSILLKVIQIVIYTISATFILEFLLYYVELSGQAVANMTREKSDTVEDGADEKMLDTDEKQQLARKDEVKFIASDRSNGDAKIDIGSIEKVCIHTKLFRHYAGC